MKLVSCLAVAFMLTPAPASAQNLPPSAVFISGNELFTVCSAPRGSGACQWYVAGVADALAMTNTLGMTRLVCLPMHVTADQLADIVLNELRDRPEFRHHGAASTVAVAFKRAFPCQ
jgi:Rap1a immunity proteins